MTVFSSICNVIHSCKKENKPEPERTAATEENESYIEEFDIDDAVLNY